MNWIKAIKNNRQNQTIWQFILFFIKRILNEQVHITSGYLSYVTLMSLVPLIVVMLSVMTAFPIFADVKDIIEDFVYQNFMPATGDVVKEHITGFVDNASKMSAIAITFLFFFALLLISAVDSSLNKIWRITAKRRIITAFSMYWMVLTLGPVLFGSSIAATSYVFSLISIGDQELFGLTNIVLSALPIFASIGAFLTLYMIVPNKVVAFKYALSGSILAAVLFEVAKEGFAFYVTQLPSYQAIYGALAAIPILFLWVYLSWLVVLFGAIFIVALEDFYSDFSHPT
jgi:membrane protein